MVDPRPAPRARYGAPLHEGQWQLRNLGDDVHRALTVAFTALAEVSDGGQVVQRGQVTGAFTGVPAAFFNPVHAWDEGPGFGDDLDAVVARGDELAVPFQVVVPSGSNHERLTEQVTGRRGLAPVERLSPGMAMASLDDVPTLRHGLTVEELRAPDEMATITDLTVLAFDLPRELAHQISGPHVLARSDLHWIVLRPEGGTPVAMAMVLVTGDVAGIFNVGVPPSRRGAGLGTAATWEAIRVGRAHGARVAVLEATDMGEPVYHRMGFETVTRLRGFVRTVG